MKAVSITSRILHHVAIGLITVIMLLTVSDVFMRFVFNNPITGTAEISQLIMVSLVLAVSWCAIEGQHVSVDLVLNRLPPRVQAIIDSITLFICLVIYAIMAWQSFGEAIRALDFKATASIMLPLPTYPFWLAYTFGIAFLCLTIIAIIVQKLKEVISNN